MNNSMINPSIMDLLNKVDDRYSLVTITSKRALKSTRLTLSKTAMLT